MRSSAPPKSQRHAIPSSGDTQTPGQGGLRGSHLHGQWVGRVNDGRLARASVDDQVAVVVGEHRNGQDFHPWRSNRQTYRHQGTTPPCPGKVAGASQTPHIKFAVKHALGSLVMAIPPHPKVPVLGDMVGPRRGVCVGGWLARTHRGSSRAGVRSGRGGTAPGPSSPAAGRRDSPAACGRTGCTWGGQTTPPALTPSPPHGAHLGEGAAARAGTPMGDTYSVTFPHVGAGGGVYPVIPPSRQPQICSEGRIGSLDKSPPAAPGSKNQGSRGWGGGEWAASLRGCSSVQPSVQEGSAHRERLEPQGFARSSGLAAGCPPPHPGGAMLRADPAPRALPGCHGPGEEGSESRTGRGKGKRETTPRHVPRRSATDAGCGGLGGTPSFIQQRFGAGKGDRCHEGRAKPPVAKPIPGTGASPRMVTSSEPAPAGTPGRDPGRNRGAPAAVGGGSPKPGSGGSCQHRAAGPRPGHRGGLVIRPEGRSPAAGGGAEGGGECHIRG